jgi:hypothetical protein
MSVWVEDIEKEAAEIIEEGKRYETPKHLTLRMLHLIVLMLIKINASLQP